MTNEEKILQALEKMQTQMDGMQSDISVLKTDVSDIKTDVSGIKVRLELDIEKKLDLLAEGHQTLLETLAPKSRVEQLEEEVSTMKTIIRLLAEKVDALGATG